MRRFLRVVSLAALLSVMLVAGNPASAQKPGGTLRVYLTASPPNMSMLELPTIVGEMPMVVMMDEHAERRAPAGGLVDWIGREAMMVDRYKKSVLTAIALALMIIAVQNAIGPSVAQQGQQKVQLCDDPRIACNSRPRVRAIDSGFL
jgi:hypothetical protein